MIVSDSTSLIHLSKIGKLSLLKGVFRKVVIPESVFEETVVQGKRLKKADAGAIESATQDWILIKRLDKKQREEGEKLLKIANIGRGEAQAIILARDSNQGLVIDDSLAQKVAETCGIETYWTTSVVLKAVSEKILTKKQAKGVLEDLVRAGYRLKPEVLLLLIEKLK